MFSYFDGGIKNTESSNRIDLPKLIRIIQSNPNAEMIARIRELRNQGDISYKSYKSQLPYITPNCMVKKRNLGEDCFNENFLSFSQYMYFDIDVPNAEEYKKYFIRQYGHLASMICLSSSGGGISVSSEALQGTEPEMVEEVPSSSNNAANEMETGPGEVGPTNNGRVPEDIPAAENDDVLAAQIRIAAEAETDPETRKKLWNEYRKYKGMNIEQ